MNDLSGQIRFEAHLALQLACSVLVTLLHRTEQLSLMFITCNN